MITDNEWHDGICIQHENGDFELYESLEDARKNWRGPPPEKSLGWFPLKYNYNKGQPLLYIGGRKASIVDLEDKIL